MLLLLVDLFGYLSILLQGATLVAQSVAVGSVTFLVLLARPLAPRLREGHEITRRAARLAAGSATALVLCEVLTIGLQGAVLMQTVGLSVGEVLGADFAIAGLVVSAAAIGLALCLHVQRPVAGGVLLSLAAIVLLGTTATTHAAARISGSAVLLTATFLHLFGAAIWLGGIPCFLMALKRVEVGLGSHLVGERFSRMSMAGVGCILASAAIFAVAYIGSWPAAYGTAYGIMVGAKSAMFGALLLLGLGNLLLIRRLRAHPQLPVLRLRRFAEVEIGVGISIFFAAASLTSAPPAVDLTSDRVPWSEIVARNVPRAPRLRSPDHDSLALSALQAQLDREAAATRSPPPAAFIPGSGEIPQRNAADVAWSEYNHHWAGLFVLAFGALAVLNAAGVRWARHWPLVLLGMAVFILVRSDPEVWPLGPIGFFASLRDVEVLQHRLFVLVTVAFGVFEWGVRTGRLRRPAAALVFPLICALGGTLLLTHTHAIGDVREQFLVEISHTALALAAIAAGWSRWLELRAEGRVQRIAAWVWPLSFLVIGAILLGYREA